MSRRWLAGLTAVAMSVMVAASARAQTHVVILTGLGGEDKYTDLYRQLGSQLSAALHTKNGLADSAIYWLSEDSASALPGYKGQSTAQNVEKLMTRLAQGAKPGDQLVLILIGHGNGTGADSKFSMPGPDLSANDFERLLGEFKGVRTAFVDLTDASGDMLPVVADSNRVVITATKSSFERNESVFARYFVKAYTDAVADVDKDGRVSLLEAYQYAAAETKRSYSDDNRLITEHAQLDDDNEKKGTEAPDGKTTEGLLARRFFLDGGSAGARAAASDPQLAKLYKDQFGLEEQIDVLEHKKAEMTPDAYDDALEQLLLSLARTSRDIRRLEGRG